MATVRTFSDAKSQALRTAGALNPHAAAVTDAAFVGHPFFDARDLVQVKYEMVRRVEAEGQSVTQTAATFGFSRPAFYTAQTALARGGLPALVRQRPGPRRRHKLRPEIVTALRQARVDEPMIPSSATRRAYSRRVWRACAPSNHRAGAGSTPKIPHAAPTVTFPPAGPPPPQHRAVDPITLTTHYEAARAQAIGQAWVGPPVVGLTVLYRWGLPAWMHLIQERAAASRGAKRHPAVSPTFPHPPRDAAATILVIASMLLACSMESSQCTPPPN